MSAGASGEGGHPDFGMSGISVPGSSGFGEQRGFGNNVSAIGLATNPSLQHDIAHVQLGYNVPGYTEMEDDIERAAMIDGMRHAMGVRALNQAGLSPSLAGKVMDFREDFSDEQERDYQNNAATASFLDANPNAGIGDIAAAIGSASQGYGNPHGFAVESPLDMSMAMASTEDDPWGVNPQEVMDTSLRAIALKAAKELSKNLDIGVAVPGLPVLEGLNIGKKALDAIPGIMGVDFPSYGTDIPGRAQDDVFEPSMDLQMEFGPVMDSDLEGVEGFMEAGGFQGGGSGVIGPDFDMGAVSEAGGEALQEALAQRVAETIIAQQVARQPKSNKITIPTSSGPDIVIDVTPPEPVRSKPVRPENVEQKNPSDSPVRIAAKTISKQKAFKKLPKFAQKELRQGKVPTTGSDHVQQMVSDFLAPTRISSAYTDMTSR